MAQGTAATEPTPMTWLSVTAGRGPEECCIAVKHAMAAIEREAKQHDLECEVVEAVPAGNGFSSALLAVSGPDPGAFAQTWNGTIQWRCKSPVRPNHGRARWFIGVSVLDPLPDAHSSIRSDDLDYQTMKASGPGGQHVNKTESAVRLLHRPSGIVVSAQEERSQHRNKALALAKLVRLLADRHADAANDAQKTRWDTHNGLERGAAIRTFEGPQFKPKP